MYLYYFTLIFKYRYHKYTRYKNHDIENILSKSRNFEIRTYVLLLSLARGIITVWTKNVMYARSVVSYVSLFQIY